MDLRIDCWSRLVQELSLFHQLILRYTPTTGLTGLDDDDGDEKKMAQQNSWFADF
uniref:Uncharacterized protein n=1 Tax=Amphimedon queenslandica TaxID=400682 RepID=A0A1X7V5D2_AMPQE